MFPLLKARADYHSKHKRFFGLKPALHSIKLQVHKGKFLSRLTFLTCRVCLSYLSPKKKKKLINWKTKKKYKILLLFCEFTELYHIPYRIFSMTEKHLWTWIQKPHQTLGARSWKLLAEKYFKAKWQKQVQFPLCHIILFFYHKYPGYSNVCFSLTCIEHFFMYQALL